MPPDSAHIDQEGVLLTNVKLVDRGRIDETRLRELLSGARYPARNIEQTQAIYDYIVATGTRETDVQRRLRAATTPLRGAGMQIGPDQAQLLAFLALSVGARNALEIGTFTGYSALAVASVLQPGGKLVAA